jgi:hypothetical protein
MRAEAVTSNLRANRPRNSFEWTFVVLLPLKVAAAVAFAIAIGEPHWIPLWLLTAAGSALIVAAAVWLIDVVASSQPRRGAIAVRVTACCAMVPAWLFGVLVSAIVAFHPIYLTFILIFSGIGTGIGIALGLVVAAMISPDGGSPGMVAR